MRLFNVFLKKLVMISMLFFFPNLASATIYTFSTNDSQIIQGNENQGWYVDRIDYLPSASNSCYVTGIIDSMHAYRGFFSFDLSELDLTDQTIANAQLEIQRDNWKSYNNLPIQVGFFDVTTDAIELNYNHLPQSNLDIYNDLGSGILYGSASVPWVIGESSGGEVLSFELNSSFIEAASNNSEQYFSIGSKVLNLDDQVRYIFGGRSGNIDPRLVIETEAISNVPIPGAVWLFVSGGILGLAGFRKKMRA